MQPETDYETIYETDFRESEAEPEVVPPRMYDSESEFVRYK